MIKETSSSPLKVFYEFQGPVETITTLDLEMPERPQKESLDQILMDPEDMKTSLELDMEKEELEKEWDARETRKVLNELSFNKENQFSSTETTIYESMKQSSRNTWAEVENFVKSKFLSKTEDEVAEALFKCSYDKESAVKYLEDPKSGICY